MTQWGLTSSLVPDWVKWVRLVLRRSHPSTSVPYQPQIHLVSRHKLDFPFQTETTTLIGQTGDPGTWAKNDARKEREKKKKLIWGCVTLKHDMADDMGACFRHGTGLFLIFPFYQRESRRQSKDIDEMLPSALTCNGAWTERAPIWSNITLGTLAERKQENVGILKNRGEGGSSQIPLLL